MAGTFQEWFAEHREQIRKEPSSGLKHAAFTTYLGLWYTLTSRWPLGTQVFEEDWDLLIVLDACRVDVLESVADEYDFLENIERRVSIGSHSREWLAKTFTRDWANEINSTAMITGNPHVEAVFHDRNYPPKETVPFAFPRWNVVHGEEFETIENLSQYDHGEGYGVPPRPITDRTITTSREGSAERIIAHYMQPHIPYIAKALEADREPTSNEARGWKNLKTSDISRADHWSLYRDNLRLVLDDIGLLLKNIDAERVLLTADHGNAFGEWGAYGHPEGFPHPSVKYVPWIELDATDTGMYDPAYTFSESGKSSVEQNLQDLGYL
ncbi:hypothetical protein RH831_09365 [Halodesulfurarchaeum sp. HSR-GB]|uniref:hypothetical protein n=1 Tax=Halodesulfurarchaeum sp. HSR-GB TaxID=3074077 RepID=UPI002864ACB0|nr:hypothetical protein [Halodesulfurarchaeum sp. HSR-GB]MDR5657387.1 hypothetical protein [Halodesulfurarchaeum sp. HSR-GB]